MSKLPEISGQTCLLPDTLPWHEFEPAEQVMLAAVHDEMRNALEDPATCCAVLDALEVAVREGVPPGPRGGKRWTPRYFVRRSARHALDHAWEIEDRTPAR